MSELNILISPCPKHADRKRDFVFDISEALEGVLKGVFHKQAMILGVNPGRNSKDMVVSLETNADPQLVENLAKNLFQYDKVDVKPIARAYRA